MATLTNRVSGTAARLCVIAALLLSHNTAAHAGIIAYTDRAAFLAALGAPATTDDYESYAAGDVANHSALGDFTYTFDAALVQPAVVAGGFGGQALGGPFDVFVGGDQVTLSFGGPGALRAFGADFAYAPAFDAIAADVYRIRVDDGTDAGAFAGNPSNLDPFGGLFFLGLIAAPGSEFSSVSLLSVVPLDADGNPVLVPAYQVDDLAYRGAQTTVPEPATLTLTLAGLGYFVARRRR